MTRLNKKKTGIAAAIALMLALIVWLEWPGGTEPTKGAAPLVERVEAGVEKFLDSSSQAGAKLALDEVRRNLRQMDVAEAREWLIQEILSGEDLPTHLNLALGTDHNLVGWPSYRVFLLDMLFLVDPQYSADAARTLLSVPERTMDELAVVMRNLARAGGTPEDMKALTQATTEMLQRKDWLKNPSTGFLEGFDLIVHTQNTAVTPELLRMSEDPAVPKLRQAAFLTLDRLVMARPVEVIPQLDKYATTHPNSQLMISNMVARADVRDVEQRQVVEAYLLNPNRTSEELRGFGATFPNASMTVSNNLVTKQKALPVEELMKLDRAALDAVTGWIADARFERAHPALRDAYQRLSSFVKP